MKIMDFLSKDAITTDLKGVKKEDVLRNLLDLLINSKEIQKADKEKIFELLLAREALGSTAIGHGVAIPHTKCDSVKKLTCAIGLSKNGVDFDSLDGEPVYIFFLLLAPTDSTGPHLKALARISRLLKDKYFRENLKQAKDKTAVLDIIRQEDERKT